MSFYRLRRAISDRASSQKLSPSFDLSYFDGVSTKKFFKDLERATWLHLPRPASSRAGKLGAWMARLDEIGDLWIEAWNSRDLERVLQLFAHEAEMVSAGIITAGRIFGKNNPRAYWSRAQIEAAAL